MLRQVQKHSTISPQHPRPKLRGLAQKTNQGLSKVPEVVKARRVHIRFGEDVGSQLTVANFGHAAHVLVFQVLFRDEKVNLGCSMLAS